jgi:hypothetical protein
MRKSKPDKNQPVPHGQRIGKQKHGWDSLALGVLYTWSMFKAAIAK